MSDTKIKTYYETLINQRESSTRPDSSNKQFRTQYLTNKNYNKEFWEEESANELNEYWKDDSTYYPQPDSISFQDKHSVRNWNSDRKPPILQEQREIQHLRHGSVQSLYRDDRNYKRNNDNYIPLSQLQLVNDKMGGRSRNSDHNDSKR